MKPNVPYAPFTIDKNEVLRALITKPESVSNVQLQWLRNQYPPNDYMQVLLAPYEHQAFARETSEQGPLQAAGQGLLMIPGYQAKKAVMGGGRTGSSLDELLSGLKGVGQGLSNYFNPFVPGGGAGW